VETIARHLTDVDPSIPFTILAFFPEYRMERYRSPTLSEMIAAYEGVKSSGLN
jgi:pyruvate-formate lyase-activating enzyme